MSILDRDQHPARFAVATSVFSGLCVALVVASFKTDLLNGTVPSWTVVVLAATALVSVGLAWVQPWRRGIRRSFLLVSAFSQHHWIGEVVHNIHRALYRRGRDVVLKIPDRDYVGACVVHHLRHIQARPSEYAGGFVIPAEVNLIRSDLVDFCREVRQPVVFMDVEPFDDERDYPENAAFVGYDPRGIGEVAANWVVDHLTIADRPDPVVLVIGDREQCRRQQRFVEVLKARIPRARVVVDEDGQAARLRAGAIARRHLDQLRIAGQQASVIFCTNDEMALGVVDALLTTGSADAAKIPVVGVNGSPEARALIDTGNSPFRATVVQDPYRAAEIAVDLLEKMLGGDKVTKRHSLRPEIYTGD